MRELSAYEPMSSTVVVSDEMADHLSRPMRESQPSFEEIHSVDLRGLAKGERYRVAITCVTRGGKTVVSENNARLTTVVFSSTATRCASMSRCRRRALTVRGPGTSMGSPFRMMVTGGGIANNCSAQARTPRISY